MKCELTSNQARLTVGDIQTLSCTGEEFSSLNFKQLQFLTVPEEKYSIKFLGLKEGLAQQYEIQFTSYAVGDHNFKDLKLSDGDKQIVLGDFGFHVESVMTQMQPPPEKPFGPMGPFQTPFPYHLLYLLLAVLVLVLFISGLKIWSVIKWQRVLEGLKEHDSAQTPANQFYQSLRKIQRAPLNEDLKSSTNLEVQKYFKDLYASWKLFLLRTYRIPAMDWSSRQIVRYIKKNDVKTYKNHKDDLYQVLIEMDRASRETNKLSKKDLNLFIDRTRILVDVIQKSSGGSK